MAVRLGVTLEDAVYHQRVGFYCSWPHIAANNEFRHILLGKTPTFKKASWKNTSEQMDLPLVTTFGLPNSSSKDSSWSDGMKDRRAIADPVGAAEKSTAPIAVASCVSCGFGDPTV